MKTTTVAHHANFTTDPLDHPPLAALVKPIVHKSRSALVVSRVGTVFTFLLCSSTERSALSWKISIMTRIIASQSVVKKHARACAHLFILSCITSRNRFYSHVNVMELRAIARTELVIRWKRLTINNSTATCRMSWKEYLLCHRSKQPNDNRCRLGEQVMYRSRLFVIWQGRRTLPFLSPVDSTALIEFIHLLWFVLSTRAEID